MKQEPRIVTTGERKLTGMRMLMSLSDNKTGHLWHSFMTRRSAIKNRLNDNLISMQVYDPSYNFEQFNPDAVFEKWAAVEVSSFEAVPEGMETFLLPAGLYAVFNHKGGPQTGPHTFAYIFGTWLPGSVYMPDHRPHFEVLGEKYKNNDPDSEEEIWIPVKNPSGTL